MNEYLVLGFLRSQLHDPKPYTVNNVKLRAKSAKDAYELAQSRHSDTSFSRAVNIRNNDDYYPKG